MEDAIETIDLGDGKSAYIVPDQDCEQPFKDDEGVHIVVLSRRYSDPAKGACGTTPGEVADWEKRNPDWYVLPMWFYDHSGIAFRAGAENPFSCRWDSGQAGIVALKRSEWGEAGCTDDQLAEYANNVATEYGEWANGECYGYVVKDSEGNEIDSCYGYVGIDNVTSAVREEHGEKTPAPAA